MIRPMLGPSVTVVLPTHNRAGSHLPAALATALGQRDVDLEVLVVDDGSSDHTGTLLAEQPDPRLRSVRHDTPEGVARARNRGVAEATGEWVAFLDDDDLWAPDKLRRQLDAAMAAGAGWAWTGGIAIDLARHPIRALAARPPEGMHRRLLAENVITCPSMVAARTDLARDVGGFDPAFQVFADWDLWIRLAAAAPGAASPEPLVGYVEHSENMWAGSRDPEQGREELELLSAKHGEAARRAGFEFGYKLRTRWAASRHRLSGRRLAAAGTYLRGGLRHRSGGDVVRAAGALLGDDAWSRARGRRFGPAELPAWLRDGP